MNFKEVRAYLDMAIELMQENRDNAAILNYAIKVLSKKQLTENARSYYVKTIFHLALIYPYLVSLLEEYVFKPFGVEKTVISKISSLLYNEGIKLKNYEAVCYALYYANKYEFEIKELNFDVATSSNNCLFLLFSYLYYEKKKDKATVKFFKDYARSLVATEMDNYWLFIYEALPQSDLQDYWKAMKKNNVSFLVEI